MKDQLLTTLRELTALHAPPGFEQPVVRYLVEAFKPLADSVEVDRFGNLYAVKQGRAAHPRLMVSAHSDEIGGMVKSILPDGFLKIDRLGGVLDSLIVGRKVWVNGHLGVVGAKSGHLQSAEERQRVQPMDGMYVDVGAASADEVRRMGIAIGDPWVWLSELEHMTNPDRIVGKGIDNRISCAVLLQLFRELQGQTIAGTLVGLVAVQEEVGLRGAKVAAEHANPDYAVVIDTFMSGDTPDVSYHKEMPTGIGRGPVMLLANSGSIMHGSMKRIMHEAAQRAGVAYQPATVIGKSSTDAATIHLAREGIPTGGLGLCRRYSHSPVETMDLNDAVGAVRWLCALVNAMGEHDERALAFV
ncbi:MAG: M20/M25/M40 family metallo-hydrolase [Chloroflexi bacterium]|nr:M20/M25/M40 family metallo-hydrolase [Chloroflexota bacterium]MBI3732075.1 M20/M25/M40 family metallo-hydrolase [Chloroflexota bacterium]